MTPDDGEEFTPPKFTEIISGMFRSNKPKSRPAKKASWATAKENEESDLDDDTDVDVDVDDSEDAETDFSNGLSRGFLGFAFGLTGAAAVLVASASPDEYFSGDQARFLKSMSLELMLFGDNLIGVPTGVLFPRLRLGAIAAANRLARVGRSGRGGPGTTSRRR